MEATSRAGTFHSKCGPVRRAWFELNNIRVRVRRPLITCSLPHPCLDLPLLLVRFSNHHRCQTMLIAKLAHCRHHGRPPASPQGFPITKHALGTFLPVGIIIPTQPLAVANLHLPYSYEFRFLQLVTPLIFIAFRRRQRSRHQHWKEDTRRIFHSNARYTTPRPRPLLFPKLGLARMLNFQCIIHHNNSTHASAFLFWQNHGGWLVVCGELDAQGHSIRPNYSPAPSVSPRSSLAKVEAAQSCIQDYSRL